MDAAQVAEVLTDHFGVEHTEADIIGIRADGDDTIAVTGFGNKVRISGGEVTVLLGPGTPVPAVVEVPEPEPEPEQPQDDLPPLEGVAADDVPAAADADAEPAPKPARRSRAKK